MPPTLLERAPVGADADSAYTGFVEWATDRGISLYPAQDEAVIELVSGANVILSTPTGTGKSLVAVAAHASCLARGGRTYYTALIQRLRSTTGQRRRKPARVGGVARDSASARADAGLDAGGRADRGVVHCANVRPACPDPAVAAGGSLGNDVPLGRLFAAAAVAGAESAVVGDLQPAVEAGFLTIRRGSDLVRSPSGGCGHLPVEHHCRPARDATALSNAFGANDDRRVWHAKAKGLLQFILRAARRQPARDSRSGVSSPMVRAPSNCMIRRNSPARMSSTYATPLGPPAISPYRSARPIRQPLGSTGHRIGDVHAGANPTVDQDLHLGLQSRTDVATMAIFATARSSCRPPWLDRITASAPNSTASFASETVHTPFTAPIAPAIVILRIDGRRMVEAVCADTAVPLFGDWDSHESESLCDRALLAD